MLNISGHRRYESANPFDRDVLKQVQFHGFIMNVNSQKYVITCAHNVKNCVLSNYTILNVNKIFDIAVLSCPHDTEAFSCIDITGNNSVVQVPEIRENTIIHNSGMIVGTRTVQKKSYQRLEFIIDISVVPGISGSPVLSSNRVLGILTSANEKQAYCVPAYSLIQCLRSMLAGRDFYTEFHGLIDYTISDSKTIISQSSVNILQCGDIITHIDYKPVDEHGNIDMTPGMNMPFWFILYHKISGSITRIRIIRNSNVYTYVRFVRRIIPAPKIKLICIGSYIIRPFKNTLLNPTERTSGILQTFMNFYRGRAIVAAVIGGPHSCNAHKCQIITAFNDVDVKNINQLNHLYLNNTDDTIVLTLLDRTKITLNYQDSIRDGNDIYAAITSKPLS